MAVHKIGDTVVHWIYGNGKIVAIDDKGLPGQPCFYYVVEGNQLTLWVPVDENGRSSLHLPTSRSDFMLLKNILRSQGEDMSNSRFQRQDRLEERMHKPSPEDACLVIRDLTFRSHRGNLSSSDKRFLKLAQNYLLDEWELSLGTPREEARLEMERILYKIPARRNIF